MRRADGSRIVNTGHSHGFVERPVADRRGFVARTYVAGGRSYARVYRTYTFRGIVYHDYVPAIHFHPLFYSWVYNPWAEPVVFTWGFNSAPWYGYYGSYYAPMPAYTTPALWLTDFLIAENLKAAYEAQEANPASNGPTVPISPEVKELIAAEVRQQLAAERDAAINAGPSDTGSDVTPEAIPQSLDPTQRVFVVSMNLNAPTPNGGTCSLTPGDIILRSTDTLGENGTVGATVLTSKPGDCPINSATAIDLATLTEMHNDFRQNIDSGLAVLAHNQGKGGLPNGPAPDPRLVPAGQVQPDLDAASAVLSQQQEAMNRQ